jgi:hypothetical protein
MLRLGRHPHAELRDDRDRNVRDGAADQRRGPGASRDRALQPPQGPAATPRGEPGQGDVGVLADEQHHGEPELARDPDGLLADPSGGLFLYLDQVGALVA